MSLYDFHCEYCDGRVREQIIGREPISHPRGIVVIESAPVGVCDRCGARYYAAPLLKRVETILKSESPPRRTVELPIELLKPASGPPRERTPLSPRSRWTPSLCNRNALGTEQFVERFP